MPLTRCLRAVSGGFFSCCLLAAMVALTNGPAAASDWLSAHKPIGDGFGVQIRDWRTLPGNGENARPWEATPRDLDTIKALGFRYIRSGAEWSVLEPDIGSFEWDGLDDFMAEARKRNFAIVFTLGGGHPAFTQPVAGARYKRYQPPLTKEAVQAFANFVAEVVRRYDGDDIVWEIWNEPDSDWQPKPDPAAYANLASAACAAIRQAAPTAKIAGPAFANLPALARDNFWTVRHRSFIATLLHSPAGTCLDAISVHSYRPDGAPPETALSDYEGAQAFIALHTPLGQKVLPVISTEWGYTTTKVTPEKQAAYALRTHLVNLLSGVPLSIWYEWRDSPRAPDDPESHYGLLGTAREDKPAFTAMNAVFPRFRDAVIEKRLPMPDPDHFVLLLRWPDGRRGLVAWTASRSSRPSFAVRVQQQDRLGYYAMSAMPVVIEGITDSSSVTVVETSR